jgi:PqqD family protein of HPr-rel-A system
VSDPGNELTGRARVRAVPDQVSSETGGEYVVLNLATGRYHGLEEVAATIWRMAEGGTTVDAIEATVMDAYDVDPDACRRDVRSFLSQLRSRGLIEVSPPDGE